MYVPGHTCLPQLALSSSRGVALHHWHTAGSRCLLKEGRRDRSDDTQRGGGEGEEAAGLPSPRSGPFPSGQAGSGAHPTLPAARAQGPLLRGRAKAWWEGAPPVSTEASTQRLSLSLPRLGSTSPSQPQGGPRQGSCQAQGLVAEASAGLAACVAMGGVLPSVGWGGATCCEPTPPDS